MSSFQVIKSPAATPQNQLSSLPSTILTMLNWHFFLLKLILQLHYQDGNPTTCLWSLRTRSRAGWSCRQPWHSFAVLQQCGHVFQRATNPSCKWIQLGLEGSIPCQLLRCTELTPIADIPRHSTSSICHPSPPLRLFRHWYDPPLIRHSARFLPLLDRRCAARSHPNPLHHCKLGHCCLDLACQQLLDCEMGL